MQIDDDPIDGKKITINLSWGWGSPVENCYGTWHLRANTMQPAPSPTL